MNIGRKIGGLLASAMMVLPLAGMTASPAHASGLVNHSEFNNIFFAERKSVFEDRANVTEYSRVNQYTNPDSYIIYYLGDFSDMCVHWVEVHVWRGSDGNLYIRPWKGVIKCSGIETRYQMQPFNGK